jgi:hypothetical protein
MVCITDTGVRAMELTFAIVIIVLLIVVIINQKDNKNDIMKINSQLDNFQAELSSFRDELQKISDDMENIILTEYDREHQTFENLPNLNISFFEKLPKGQIINLISGSYYYPSEEISLSRFQYKHDHIDKNNKTEFGWEIRGFEKFYDDDEWSPCTFLADENECQTSSCSGTIKKVV